MYAAVAGGDALIREHAYHHSQRRAHAKEISERLLPSEARFFSFTISILACGQEHRSMGREYSLRLLLLLLLYLFILTYA